MVILCVGIGAGPKKLLHYSLMVVLGGDVKQRLAVIRRVVVGAWLEKLPHQGYMATPGGGVKRRSAVSPSLSFALASAPAASGCITASWLFWAGGRVSSSLSFALDQLPRGLLVNRC
jgi:hypothetical protein